MLEFSRHYSAHAHQTQRSGPIPDRYQRWRNVRNDQAAPSCLRFFRTDPTYFLTQQLALAEQRAHEQGYKGTSEYDEDGAGYQDEFKAGGDLLVQMPRREEESVSAIPVG
jgi:hypothetical protein